MHLEDAISNSSAMLTQYCELYVTELKGFFPVYVCYGFVWFSIIQPTRAFPASLGSLR